ncbi:hypothetical protein Tco_1555838 [Tanacetum coccineum]
MALVAHTGSSSRNTSSYYVTHPTSVVDYEDEYQQDDVHTNSEDPLTSAMLNQAIIQGDRVNIQSRNSGNAGRNNRRAYVQEEIIEGSNAPNETENVQRTLRTSSSGNTSTVQCYNCSGKGHYVGINDFLFADASRMEEIEELGANICLIAIIHQLTPKDPSADIDENGGVTLQAKIKILEKDVQRCQKQSVDFELKLQHAKEKHKWESTLNNKNTNLLDYSWISKMEKLENENVSLDFQVQYLMKEQENVKIEYQKLFDSIKKTQSQSQKEMDELIAHVSEKTYTYGAIRAENLNLLSTISELKTRLETIEKVSKPVTLQTSPDKKRGANSNNIVIVPGMYRVVTTQESQTNKAKSDFSSTRMNDASSVRRPMNRDSLVKNSVLANSKNLAKKVTVYVRKNKQIESENSETKRM